MSKKNKVELLGSLPLDIAIRQNADSGKPSLVAEPSGKTSEIYKEIARKATANLALKTKDFSTRFPNIVIQNT
jgi:ATP-binding protein involved in chromosome partitioning